MNATWLSAECWGLKDRKELCKVAHCDIDLFPRHCGRKQDHCLIWIQVLMLNLKRGLDPPFKFKGALNYLVHKNQMKSSSQNVCFWYMIFSHCFPTSGGVLAMLMNHDWLRLASTWNVSVFLQSAPLKAYSHLWNLGHGHFFFFRNSQELGSNSNQPVAHSVLHLWLQE